MFNLLFAVMLVGNPLATLWQYGGYYTSHKACMTAAKVLFPENTTGYFVCISVRDGSTPVLEN